MRSRREFLQFAVASAGVFSVGRIGWLIRLRWLALLGIGAAAVLAALGAFPGVNWPMLLLTAAAAGIYNGLLWRAYRDGAAQESAAR